MSDSTLKRLDERVYDSGRAIAQARTGEVRAAKFVLPVEQLPSLDSCTSGATSDNHCRGWGPNLG